MMNNINDKDSEIESLNKQYEEGLDAWKKNNAFHLIEIEKLRSLLNESLIKIESLNKVKVCKCQPE